MTLKSLLIEILLGAGLLLLMIWIGGQIKDPPRQPQPWVQDIDRSFRTKSATEQYKSRNVSPAKYGWETDKSIESLKWQDFLEEIEDRGYNYDDPEAIEIWDSNYN